MRWPIIFLVFITISMLQVLAIDKGKVRHQWLQFKLKYNRSYPNILEERRRYKVFANNARMISKHNKRYEQGSETYAMAINIYADISQEEFYYKTIHINRGNTTRIIRHSLNRINRTRQYSRKRHWIEKRNYRTLPIRFDWREKGAVTRVKHQGKCGSCWAFSATGALEGHHFIKTGKLVPFSEQNLIDCSGRYGNQGCHGGYPRNAFKYIKNEGIAKEKHYKYKGYKGKCRYNKQIASNKSLAGTAIRGYKIIRNSEYALKKAVVRYGPVAVLLDATDMWYYSHGIYYNRKCRKNYSALDHTGLVVGYGYNKGAYWIIKFASTSLWGERGYIRLARNKSNHCGVVTQAVVPI